MPPEQRPVEAWVIVVPIVIAVLVIGVLIVILWVVSGSTVTYSPVLFLGLPWSEDDCQSTNYLSIPLGQIYNMHNDYTCVPAVG